MVMITISHFRKYINYYLFILLLNDAQNIGTSHEKGYIFFKFFISKYNATLELELIFFSLKPILKVIHYVCCILMKYSYYFQEVLIYAEIGNNVRL